MEPGPGRVAFEHMADPLHRTKRLFDPLRSRLKPAFLVLGTQKAGTSALFEMLRLHPRILAPKVKEPHFFNREDEFAKGMAYYFKQFPLVPLRGPEPITFEASAGYLYNPLAPERIKKHLPDAELFAVLRDPVQRAFSAWNMFRQFENTPFFPDYHDPRTFEQAVEDEISGKPMHVAHRYLDRGVYAPQLERYIKLFGRDRVHVFAYPEFKSAPHVVVDSICATMGLGPLPPQEGLSRIRSNERPYSHGMSSELRERLTAWFAPHHRVLESVLGGPIDLQETR